MRSPLSKMLTLTKNKKPHYLFSTPNLLNSNAVTANLETVKDFF